MTSDQDLLDRQRRLQDEADAVEADLGLKSLLAGIGEPVRVGSSALGLMVKRDVDLTVVCAALDGATREAVIDLGGRLARHERVGQVTLRDDTGAWNADPEAYPDGLFLHLRYRSPAGADWSFDVWFVDEPERQPDLAHLRTLLPRLTDETRVAILRLKETWVERPEYGRTVNGAAIYAAVLDGGVRTPDELTAWLAARGKHE